MTTPRDPYDRPQPSIRENVESSIGKLSRLDREFHRLFNGLHDMGYEALRVESETPEEGIVDSVLSIIRQLAAIAGVQNGWMVPAGRLRPGMVVENSGYPRGEPQVLHILNVTPADDPDMVHVHAQNGYVSRPVAADWPFELRTQERADLEADLMGAERDRLGITSGSRV